MKATSALLFTAALSVGGCAFPKSAEEQTAALRPYFACAQAAIPRLDDGRSDAQTVAIAAQAMCVPEWQAYLDVALSGEAPSQKGSLGRALKAEDVKDITVLVLRYRTTRRAP